MVQGGEKMDKTMTTIIAASSEKHLNEKLTKIRNNHETMNPHSEVEVRVISPDPDKVTFNDWESQSFTVSVRLRTKEKDN
jgi:hypothetical protein